MASFCVWLEDENEHRAVTERKLLEEMGAEAPEFLRRELQSSLQTHRRHLGQFGCLVSFTAAVVLLMCRWISFSPEPNGLIGILFVPLWLLFPFYPAWYDAFRANRQRLRDAMLLMRDYPSVQGIANVIAATQIRDEETSSFASEVLQSLLPRLQEGDAGLLGRRERRYLYRILYGYHAERILAVLQALGQIQDIAAIPHVQRLTNCPSWVAENAPIRKAAVVCLTRLRKCETKRRVAGMLLRAVCSSTIQEDNLLHTVQEEDVGL